MNIIVKLVLFNPKSPLLNGGRTHVRSVIRGSYDHGVSLGAMYPDVLEMIS